MRATATFFGNTHGSIAQINDQWYVFYHRQADTTEFSRQAMVAPVQVSVTEGAQGKVYISEAEYTSEGFDIDGLDPLGVYPAGIACYYTNPEPMSQEYPSVIYPGSHTRAVRSAYSGHGDPYSLEINKCPMVNNTDGSVVGYKYFNFSKTKGLRRLSLRLAYIPEGVDGTVDIFIDSPDAKKGRKVASLDFKAGEQPVERTVSLPVSHLSRIDGKHPLFFVFQSAEKGRSLCTLCTLGFTAELREA